MSTFVYNNHLVIRPNLLVISYKFCIFCSQFKTDSTLRKYFLTGIQLKMKKLRFIFQIRVNNCLLLIKMATFKTHILSENVLQKKDISVPRWAPFHV